MRHPPTEPSLLQVGQGQTKTGRRLLDACFPAPEEWFEVPPWFMSEGRRDRSWGEAFDPMTPCDSLQRSVELLRLAATLYDLHNPCSLPLNAPYKQPPVSPMTLCNQPHDSLIPPSRSPTTPQCPPLFTPGTPVSPRPTRNQRRRAAAQGVRGAGWKPTAVSPCGPRPACGSAEEAVEGAAGDGGTPRANVEARARIPRAWIAQARTEAPARKPLGVSWEGHGGARGLA